MRTLLILASALGVAYAGVGTLSPSEEADALQLFAKLCSGYGSAEGQDIGGTLVYCKRANGDRQETLNHNVNVQSDRRPPAQVVFVQPPPVRYQHRVLVQGSNSQGQQTKVYVLPQQATHEVNADFRGGQITPVKPTVYFLKGGDSPNTGSNYGPPGLISSSPDSSYGAPIKSSGYSG